MYRGTYMKNALRFALALMLCIPFFATPLETVSAQTSGTNLVPNGSLESAGGSGLPASWKKGGYGTNTRSLTYPVPGVGGGKAIKTAITSYTNGDAKWYFNPVSISPGTYVYSNEYMSDRVSFVTVQFQNTSGAFSYKDVATLPAAAGAFTPMSAEFTVPANTANVTVFHLIKGVGFVTIDNVAIYAKGSTPPPPPPPPPPPSGGNIFNTGAVSLRFDDGLLSQYEDALPKLNSAGLKGTFYIITQEMAEQGFAGYMNKQQVVDIFNAGHEIGAHTRTHKDLTTLSPSAQQNEVAGSRQDLQSWNVGSILSLSVPFGAYDNPVINVVKNAGFSSMTTSDGHQFNKPDSDRYTLTRIPGDNRLTVPQIKQKIDTAIAQKEWAVIAFHHIDTTGDPYSITPTEFNQIIDYIVQKGIRVVTVSEGAQYLQ